MVPMAEEDDCDPAARRARGAFATTRWTLVAEAAMGDSPEAEEAMEALSLRYWFPLYAFLRRKGLKAEQAEDMTQEFFAQRILTKQIFKGSDRSRGKFRSWLLTSLQNFLNNERDKERAQKRGGGAVHLSLDFREGEERYLAEPFHNLTPEKIYARTWALTQLDATLDTLRDQYENRGQSALFDELKSFLPGAGAPPPHRVVAERTGKTEAAIKMAVSRLRREFGKALRGTIGSTVSDAAELEEEMRDLLNALTSPT